MADDNFVRVKCPDCDNEQIVFKKAATQIKCDVCGTLLAKPKGGNAEINGEVLGAVERWRWPGGSPRPGSSSYAQ